MPACWRIWALVSVAVSWAKSASRIRERASDTFSMTTERLATVDARRFWTAPRSPRADEIVSRIASAAYMAVLALDTLDTLTLRSVVAEAVVVASPVSCADATPAFVPSTVVMVPPAWSVTPPRATTFSVATVVVKPNSSPPATLAPVPAAWTEMFRPSEAVRTMPAVPVVLATTPLIWAFTASTNCCRRVATEAPLMFTVSVCPLILTVWSASALLMLMALANPPAGSVPVWTAAVTVAVTPVVEVSSLIAFAVAMALALPWT